MKPRAAIFILFISLTAALNLSCSRKPETSPKADQALQSAPTVQPSQSPLEPPQFDYKNATELLISKNDPTTGDRWSARIVRDGAPSLANENSWTIEMGPDEIKNGDPKAHGNFILHMLDTIRTLPLKRPAVSGSLESFGLATPLFDFQWSIQDGATKTQYEMKLGAPVKAENGEFGGLYAIFTSPAQAQPQVVIANGALLEMLGRISTFQTLRLPTLATFTSDDVDEIQIGRSFYAQRDGSDWTNAKHKQIHKEIDTFLEQATHLRVLKFIDDPKAQAPLRKLLSQPHAQTLSFKSRQGVSTTIKIDHDPNGTYATISTRFRINEKGKTELCIFEIYPEFQKQVATLLK